MEKSYLVKFNRACSEIPVRYEIAEFRGETRSDDEAVYVNIQQGGATKSQSKFCNCSRIRGFRTCSKGFTLLEMVVSTGIFFVVIILAVGLAIAISDAQIKASGLQTIQDNVRFSLELMTKEIRTGFDYALTSSCGGSSELSFEATSGPRVYYLDTATSRIMRGTNCADATPFTSDDMIVNDLKFIIRGNSPGPTDGQPTITISIVVRSASDKQKLESSMNLQTTIVQRTKDL